MATVHVSAVTFGWPESAEDDPIWGTADLTVDGKYVRMQYDSTLLSSAAVVQAKLTTDSAILLLPAKQKVDAFPMPTMGVDHPELCPADFNV